MQPKLLMQALQSEGVSDVVLFEAFVKAELADMELRAQRKVGRILDITRDEPNPFMSDALRVKIAKRAI